MEETLMPPAWAANLVANGDNTIYGVSLIDHYQTTSKWNHFHKFCHVLYDIVTALAGTWPIY